MNLLVLTPEKELFNGTIKAVKVPGTTGEFEIRENHASIVSSLRKGPVKITNSSGQVETIPIKKGFIEVINNEVSILVQAEEAAE